MLVKTLKQYLYHQRAKYYQKCYLNCGITNSIKICIVGAGPAGFYAAQYLLKQLPNCQVDVLEKLPVPFGLVRFGVAPDHPEVKNVINTFTKTAENPRFHFYGNVCLGQDISLNQLRDRYHAVLLTYGADTDRQLNVPNENQANVMSARDFVAWYNGLPGAESLTPDLSGNTVTIIGQGNVAVDVARMLLTPISKLKQTDITSYAWEALSCSKIQKVYLVGRRGPLQVAFTIKELREMLKLPQVTTLWKAEDFHRVLEVLEILPRPRKRLTELMLKSLKEQTQQQQLSKQFLPIFMRSPKFIYDKQITFTINEMEKDTALPTNMEDILFTDLILRSIGYKASCADNGICFDTHNGRVFNNQGRILKFHANPNDLDIGLYVAGWLATGPTGVILTTMNNAFFVAKLICEDISAKRINTEEVKQGLEDALKAQAVVSWEGWCKIDREEMKRGQVLGKPREKIIKIDEMLQVAGY